MEEASEELKILSRIAAKFALMIIEAREPNLNQPDQEKKAAQLLVQAIDVEKAKAHQ